MGVLKARVDSTWVEVGSGVGGVPAGGTTGQILTKTSAADYATAWSGVILSNNVPLAGKRVDGSLQGLIGVGDDDHVYVGATGLPAGKSVRFNPPVTLVNGLTLADAQYVLAGALQILYPVVGSNTVYFAQNTNARFNTTSGQTNFDRDVGIAGTLYKGAVPYTHPDFVFEHHFTGGIERFRDAPGADTYEGLWPLARVEEFAQEHWRLPGHAARENDRVDIFRRTHDLLAECERLYLHMFDHEKRLAALEGR